MIRGAFSERLEPMVAVEISNGDGLYHPVEALMDTGFSQHLTLPPDTVERLGLKRVDRIPMTLADDRDIQVSVHEGFVKWLGQVLQISVIAMDGPSLLGMSMLANCKVTFSAQEGGELLIEAIRET